MAIGLTPKYTEVLPLESLSQEQFLMIAYEATKKLGWTVSFMSETGLIANSSKGMFSWNSEVKIKIENELATLISSSTGSEMMDWGKNKKAIKSFISAFEEVKPAFTNEELALKHQELKQYIVRQKKIFYRNLLRQQRNSSLIFF